MEKQSTLNRTAMKGKQLRFEPIIVHVADHMTVLSSVAYMLHVTYGGFLLPEGWFIRRVSRQ